MVSDSPTIIQPQPQPTPPFNTPPPSLSFRYLRRPRSTRPRRHDCDTKLQARFLDFAQLLWPGARGALIGILVNNPASQPRTLGLAGWVICGPLSAGWLDWL
jgi:hypothetical protein